MFTHVSEEKGGRGGKLQPFARDDFCSKPHYSTALYQANLDHSNNFQKNVNFS